MKSFFCGDHAES